MKTVMKEMAKYSYIYGLSMLVCCTCSYAQWKLAGNRIVTEWAAQVDVSNVLSEYPRPLMECAEWINLNGLWQYAILPSGKATLKTYDGEILVPFTIESALSGIGKKLGENNELWYQRTFSVPFHWKEQRVLLNFGAVDDRLGMIVWQDMPNGNKNQDWQHKQFYYEPEMVRTSESETIYQKEWKEVKMNANALQKVNNEVCRCLDNPLPAKSSR